MPFAYNLTRRDIHYRHEVFTAGLKAAGFKVESLPPAKGRLGDVLLIWNRYGQYHDIAKQFERGGGTVIVVENGYLGKDKCGNQLYAMAIGGHNGSGQWNVGGPERFAALGVDLHDWRREGGYILVCPNRSFGRPDMIMPPDWTREVCAKIKRFTNREIRVRQHPAVVKPKNTLDDDLAGAKAVVIWGSSAGVHALVAGVPVFQESPHWICAAAASNNLAMIESPAMDDSRRLSALQNMAWAQWSLGEIETGAPFDHLLRPTRQAQVLASA